jgi:hypothetical protein
MTERILFYTNENSKTGLQSIHNNKDCFEPIKTYMKQERKKVMDKKKFVTIDQFNIYIKKLTNTTSSSRHYFSDSQYAFPTKKII